MAAFETSFSLQARLLRFTVRANIVVFALFSLLSLLVPLEKFTRGTLCGGLLVTFNFFLADRSLQRSFRDGGPPPIFAVVMAKHYLRFLVTGAIIFWLISSRLVHPLGLLLGLSVVVVSLLAASVVAVRQSLAESTGHRKPDGPERPP